MLPATISDEIVRKTREIMGDKLQSVILYGSFARGDNDAESDVDIALLLRRKLDNREHDAMISLFSDLCLTYDRVFSPMDIVMEKYNQWADMLPFYQNIRREGIVLWKAA